MHLQPEATVIECEECRCDLTEQTHYFATDIGQVFLYGIAFCSPSCWQDNQDRIRSFYSKKQVMA